MNLLLKLSYLNSNLAPTLGYLNPALSNQAQDLVISPSSRHSLLVVNSSVETARS